MSSEAGGPKPRRRPYSPAEQGCVQDCERDASSSASASSCLLIACSSSAISGQRSARRRNSTADIRKKKIDLPPPIGNGAAARQPPAFDRVKEFVRFPHLDQDVAALHHLRRWRHGGQQLGLAAL